MARRSTLDSLFTHIGTADVSESALLVKVVVITGILSVIASLIFILFFDVGREERFISTTDVAHLEVTATAEESETTATAPMMVVEETRGVEPQSIIVDVSGAVVAPGVFELSEGSRIADAVTLAGGLTPEADLARINLAALMEDGMKIHVPQVGEPEPAPPVQAGSRSMDEATAVVRVNTADVQELMRLPGVGEKTAAAIVSERQKNGPFSSVDDLERVSGIGPAKIEGFRDLVEIG